MRYSVHVDAGYLYAALATRETGSANRAAIKVDERALVKALVDLADADLHERPGSSGMRLLRVLWYDAARDGIPDQHQRTIGMIDSVKLRMGRISPAGDQKGVDLRLGLDLVSMAVNRSVEVAYLISGDDDLTEAVTDAQQLGLQIKLIVVPSAASTQPIAVAANLGLEVDGILTIPDGVIKSTVTRVSRPPAAAVAAVAATTTPPSAAVATPPPPEGTKPSRPTVIPPPLSTPGAAPVRRLSIPSPLPHPVAVAHGNAVDVVPPTPIGSEQINEVAQSVFDVWVGTASTEELEDLLAGRPNVPPQIDRILLADLVNRTGVYDIPTSARFDLRRAFWSSAAHHPG